MISMSLDTVRSLLRRDIGRYRTPGVNIKATYSDHLYSSPSHTELVAILAKVASAVPDSTHYVEEMFDCDDFSYVLKGQVSLYGLESGLPAPLTIGIVWAKFNWRDEFHVANWAIVDGDRVVWIEPQDLNSTKNWGLHDVTDCRGELAAILL